ncbi:unnamed protein product [Protopolystoma xenopodis]|uniref:Uncharacterized protein n=1 Tax=Protopolystoma xenopodis TaxID=117903 RepID=A0A3S5B650_9PLAT|nr:unnamed protein product [Protopolystoma xenopodis]
MSATSRPRRQRGWMTGWAGKWLGGGGWDRDTLAPSREATTASTDR